MLEVSLIGIGTVPRLERDQWSKVKLLSQATKENAPPPHDHNALLRSGQIRTHGNQATYKGSKQPN